MLKPSITIAMLLAGGTAMVATSQIGASETERDASGKPNTLSVEVRPVESPVSFDAPTIIALDEMVIHGAPSR